jgi:dihydropteroate synthase
MTSDPSQLNKYNYPLIVGILNISPDSFSSQTDAPLTINEVKGQIAELIASGADVIEIGGESTRPGAIPLTQPQEATRLRPFLPIIAEIANSTLTTFALDTRYGQTARMGVDHGITMINDVSGGRDPEMLKLLTDLKREQDLRYVATHSLTVPANPKVVMTGDVIEQLVEWTHNILRKIIDCGFPAEQLIIDPGIGFGKTGAQCFKIVRCLQQIKDKTKAPLFIGHSRKSFLALNSEQPAYLRDLETHVLTSLICQNNAIDYLRVHDVAGTRRTLTLLSKYSLTDTDY